jgi:hypothetical protein
MKYIGLDIDPVTGQVDAVEFDTFEQLYAYTNYRDTTNDFVVGAQLNNGRTIVLEPDPMTRKVLEDILNSGKAERITGVREL